GRPDRLRGTARSRRQSGCRVRGPGRLPHRGVCLDGSDRRRRQEPAGRAMAPGQDARGGRGQSAPGCDLSVKRGRSRILTTHVGSLVRPVEMVEILRRKADGAPFSNGERAILARHVSEAVSLQAECGIDIPSDGEYSKSGFAQYITDRLTGFEVR